MICYHTPRTCCSTVRPSVAARPPRKARYRISILVVSVLPAPLSPLTRIELLFPSWTIALYPAKAVQYITLIRQTIIVINVLKLGGTCKQHLRWQRHEGLILQMALPCIVASCVNHTNEAIFEMDLSQLRYFLYKSVIISNIKIWALLSEL